MRASKQEGVWGQAVLRHKRLPTSFTHNQKRSKIVSKLFQNRGPKGVWAALGRLLGGSWAVPGSKAPLDSLLAAPWAVLGRFLKRLGRLLGGSWAVLGTKLGRLGGPWRHLRGVLVGFSHQNGAKLVSKSVKSWILC